MPRCAPNPGRSGHLGPASLWCPRTGEPLLNYSRFARRDQPNLEGVCEMRSIRSIPQRFRLLGAVVSAMMLAIGTSAAVQATPSTTSVPTQVACAPARPCRPPPVLSAASSSTVLTSGSVSRTRRRRSVRCAGSRHSRRRRGQRRCRPQLSAMSAPAGQQHWAAGGRDRARIACTSTYGRRRQLV